MALIRVAAIAVAFLLGACAYVPVVSEVDETVQSKKLIPSVACDDARAALLRIRSIGGLSGPSSDARNFGKMNDVESTALAARSKLHRKALFVLGNTLALDEPIVAGKAPADAERPLDLSWSELDRDLKGVQDAAERGAFASLAARSTAGNEAGKLALYPLYFANYFRRGHFFTVKIDTEAATTVLRKQVLEGLNLKDGDLNKDQRDLVDKAVASLLGQVCKDAKCIVVDESGDGAFLNRAGQKFGFPTVDVSIVPGSNKGIEVTKLDQVQVVGDLTRIAWEATFDTIMWEANLQPLANMKATACAIDKGPFDCLKKDDTRQDDLARLNAVADRTEGVTGAFAAKLVRGGALFALNNEAVAKLLETTASVWARKLAEIVVSVNMKHCPTQPPQGDMREVTFIFRK